MEPRNDTSSGVFVMIDQQPEQTAAEVEQTLTTCGPNCVRVAIDGSSSYNSPPGRGLVFFFLHCSLTISSDGSWAVIVGGHQAVAMHTGALGNGTSDPKAAECCGCQWFSALPLLER